MSCKEDKPHGDSGKLSFGHFGEVGNQAHLNTGSHFERFNFVDKASA